MALRATLWHWRRRRAVGTPDDALERRDGRPWRVSRIDGSETNNGDTISRPMRSRESRQAARGGPQHGVTFCTGPDWRSSWCVVILRACRQEDEHPIVRVGIWEPPQRRDNMRDTDGPAGPVKLPDRRTW